MTITRATIETLVVRRCRNLMEVVGFALTYTGVNDDLNDPIGWAIRQKGGAVSNPVSVSDADIATVSEAELDALVDLAEYRTLVNIKGNYALVDTKSGPYSEALSQNTENLEALISLKWLYIQSTYGIGSPTMEAGVISDEFAAHSDDEFGTE